MAVSSLLRPPGTLPEPQSSRPSLLCLSWQHSGEPQPPGPQVAGRCPGEETDRWRHESALERRLLDKPTGQQGYLRPRSQTGPWLGPLRGWQTPSSHSPSGESAPGTWHCVNATQSPQGAPWPLRTLWHNSHATVEPWKTSGLLPPPPLCPLAGATSLSRLLPHFKPPPQPFSAVFVIPM